MKLLDILQEIDDSPKDVYLVHERFERHYDMHSHQRDQLSFVEGGVAYVTIENEYLVVPAMHFLWFPQGCLSCLMCLIKVRHSVAFFLFQKFREGFLQRFGNLSCESIDYRTGLTFPNVGLISLWIIRSLMRLHFFLCMTFFLWWQSSKSLQLPTSGTSQDRAGLAVYSSELPYAVDLEWNDRSVSYEWAELLQIIQKRASYFFYSVSQDISHYPVD